MLQKLLQIAGIAFAVVATLLTILSIFVLTTYWDGAVSVLLDT